MSEREVEGNAGGAIYAPFHIANLDAARQVAAALAGSCLDPARPLEASSPQELLAANAAIFTSGGSWPRDLWADTALGARIQCSVAETGEKIDLVDLCSMTCNTVLGINDPWVKLKQTAFLLSAHPHYLPVRIGCDLYYRVAQRILNTLSDFGSPGDFVINMRQCNGSDAVELALHAAWKAAAASLSRRQLATFRGSYHGESIVASLLADDQAAERSGRALVDAVDNVTRFASPECDDGGYLTIEARETLSRLERDGDQYFAAIIEPIQWSNSVRAVPLAFLRALRDVCTRKSICLIFDEVQNAFGYTGTMFFAQNCGVCPDIIATGKALTSGHGALAIVVAKERYGQIEAPFGSKTNSGEMLALVAVDAVIDRLLGLELEDAQTLPEWLPAGLANDLRVGLLSTAYPHVVGLLDDLLSDLQQSFPGLTGESTGMGLMRGLVLLDADGEPSGALAAEVARIGLRHDVYVRRAGAAVYFKPCLALNAADCAEARDRLHATIAEVQRVRDRSESQ